MIKHSKVATEEDKFREHAISQVRSVVERPFPLPQGRHEDAWDQVRGAQEGRPDALHVFRGGQPADARVQGGGHRARVAGAGCASPRYMAPGDRQPAAVTPSSACDHAEGTGTGETGRRSRD